MTHQTALIISVSSALSQKQQELHEHAANMLRGEPVYLSVFADSKLYCLVTEAAVCGDKLA